MTNPYENQIHRAGCGCARVECQKLRDLAEQLAELERQSERAKR